MVDRLTMTRTYNVLPSLCPTDLFEPKINEFFAWLPMILKNGHLTWMKTVYYRKQICRAGGGRVYYDEGWYSSEEMTMLKLRGGDGNLFEVTDTADGT